MPPIYGCSFWGYMKKNTSAPAVLIRRKRADVHFSVCCNVYRRMATFSASVHSPVQIFSFISPPFRINDNQSVMESWLSVFSFAHSFEKKVCASESVPMFHWRCSLVCPDLSRRSAATVMLSVLSRLGQTDANEIIKAPVSSSSSSFHMKLDAFVLQPFNLLIWLFFFLMNQVQILWHH